MSFKKGYIKMGYKQTLDMHNTLTRTENIYSKRLQQTNIGLILVPCLQELVELRPEDPITFIAHWLYKYACNRLYFEDKAWYTEELRRTQLSMKEAVKAQAQKDVKFVQDLRDLQTKLPPEEFPSHLNMLATSKPIGPLDRLARLAALRRPYRDGTTFSMISVDRTLSGFMTNFDHFRTRRELMMIITQKKSIKTRLRRSFRPLKMKPMLSYPSEMFSSLSSYSSLKDSSSSSNSSTSSSSNSSSSSSSSTEKRSESPEPSDTSSDVDNRKRKRSSEFSSSMQRASADKRDSVNERRHSHAPEIQESRSHHRDHDGHFDSDGQLRSISNQYMFVAEDGTELVGHRKDDRDGFMDDDGIFYEMHERHGQNGYFDKNGKFQVVRKVHERSKSRDKKEGSGLQAYVSEDGMELTRHRHDNKDGYMDKDGNFYELCEREGREGFIDMQGKFRFVRKRHEGRKPRADIYKYRTESGRELTKHRSGDVDGYIDNEGVFYKKYEEDGHEGFLDKTGKFKRLRKVHERRASIDHKQRSEMRVYIAEDGMKLTKRHFGDKDGYIDSAGNFYEMREKDGREGYVDNNGTFQLVQKHHERGKPRAILQFHIAEDGTELTRHRSGEKDGYVDNEGNFYEMIAQDGRDGYLDHNGMFQLVRRQHGRRKRRVSKDRTGSGSDSDDFDVDSVDSDSSVGEETHKDGNKLLRKRSRRNSRSRKRRLQYTCYWRVHGTPPVLVCYHSLLGPLKAPHRNRVAEEKAANFWGNYDYNCEVHYDQEIYTVCDANGDDETYGHLMRDWNGETWLTK